MFSRSARPVLSQRIVVALSVPLALILCGVLLVRASTLGAAQPSRLSTVPSTGTISGTVLCSGSVSGTHMVWVGAFTTTQGGSPLCVTSRTGPGPYTLTGVAAGVYHVMAGMDADDSGGDPNPNVDPLGTYAGNPLSVPSGGLVEGVDVVLQDPSGPPQDGGYIAGSISYEGRLSSAANTIIFASWMGGDGPPDYAAVVYGTGPYSITNVADGDYSEGAVH